MRYLSKRADQVIKDSKVVQMWVKAKDKKIDSEVAEVNGPVWIFMAGAATFFSSLFFLLGVLIWMAPGQHNTDWKPWPVTGTIDLFIGTIGLLVWIIAGLNAPTKTARLQKIKKQELQAKQNEDPLYVRGKLILKAIQDYRRHVDKYRAWFDAVDEELTAADEETANRYHDFISHSSEILAKAISNFQNAAELQERQETYQTQHPELAADSTSTALTELLALLNEPVEMPPEVALADPRVALGHEENLAALSRDLSGETLSRQIEEAAATVPLEQ